MSYLADKIRELEAENERLKRPLGPADRLKDREELRDHRVAILAASQRQADALEAIAETLADMRNELKACRWRP